MSSSSSSSSSSQWEQTKKRRSIHLPLLDLSSTSTSEYINKIVTPLPSSHLPPELRTINLYGMELDRPVHKMLIQNAIDRGSGGNVKGELVGESERVYGHIVWKPNDDNDSLVGSVGCTAEVLISAPTTEKSGGGMMDEKGGEGEEEEDGGPITVLVRGGYRFVVREVTQTFPFPVGVVDELLDDDVEDPSTPVTKSTDDDEEEDDDYDTNTNLSPSELVQKTLQSTNDLLQQQLTESTSSSKQQLTPLEQSILESKGVPITSAISEQNQVEEMMAVLHIFQSTLIDIAPSSKIELYYVVAMMAAELSNVNNDIRTKILIMKNGLERLRLVLKIVDEKVKMGRARKMATQITDEADEDMKDLKVGTPELPPWSKSMTSGTRIEYYWSEEDGWCSGEVIDSPMKIVDELVVTVRFDDGETHRLPFRPEEKARWRPA